MQCLAPFSSQIGSFGSKINLAAALTCNLVRKRRRDATAVVEQSPRTAACCIFICLSAAPAALDGVGCPGAPTTALPLTAERMVTAFLPLYYRLLTVPRRLFCPAAHFLQDTVSQTIVGKIQCTGTKPTAAMVKQDLVSAQRMMGGGR